MSREHENDDNSELLNTIFLGEVASVQNYGAFIKIPGSRNQGLIHRSQISNSPVEDATEILQRGERVWCKVISVTEDNKIALSMKVVNQGSGTDLDPNGVQIQQDEQRRKNYDPRNRKKVIELDAVFNTVCSKCGTHGHLKKDCFKSSDGKTYELLLDEDDDDNVRLLPPLSQRQPQPVDVDKTTEPKLDKSKKDKKKKKKHKKESKSKKSKKHKKLKRKHRKKSSDSSSSDDSSEESSEEEHRKHRSSKRDDSSRKRKHSRSPSHHQSKR